MNGITSWSSISEHEFKGCPLITAELNEDGSYQAWVVGHDGITMHVPRCQVALKALANGREPEERLFTITIPEGAKL